MVDFRINKVMEKDWLEEDFLASRFTLLKMKQLRTKHILYVIPMLLVYLVFFSYDVYIHMPPELPAWLIGGGIVGAIVGLGIA